MEKTIAENLQLLDALRIAVSTVPYKKDIFFNKSDFHINTKGEVALTAQFDLYLEDVPQYLIEVWAPEHLGSRRLILSSDKTCLVHGMAWYKAMFPAAVSECIIKILKNYSPKWKLAHLYPWSASEFFWFIILD